MKISRSMKKMNGKFSENAQIIHSVQCIFEKNELEKIDFFSLSLPSRRHKKYRLSAYSRHSRISLPSSILMTTANSILFHISPILRNVFSRNIVGSISYFLFLQIFHVTTQSPTTDRCRYYPLTTLDQRRSRFRENPHHHRASREDDPL